MDRELQYHARMDLPGKHAKAVKRMTARLHCRESGEMVPFHPSSGLFTLARVCPAALCRRGTAAAHTTGARPSSVTRPFSVKGLFQHISGI
jgi:hypothetical protein